MLRSGQDIAGKDQEVELSVASTTDRKVAVTLSRREMELASVKRELKAGESAELTLTPAPNSGADFKLTVTATAHDSITGVEAHATTQLPITVIDTVSVPSPEPIPSVTARSRRESATP